MKAFCSWSGGKDSCLALYRGMKNYEVTYLLNMLTEDGKYSRAHGLPAELLKLQSECIGIGIVQPKSLWENYEEVFKKILCEFKLNGVNIGIFGDIDLQEHRDWVVRVCSEVGIVPFEPLWRESRELLINEFIQLGFKAIVVATNGKYLGSEWLGREIDNNFIDNLKKLDNVDLCGEKGEYHSFVYAGPIFNKPVDFDTGEKFFRDNHWFLEIKSKL